MDALAPKILHAYHAIDTDLLHSRSVQQQVNKFARLAVPLTIARCQQQRSITYLRYKNVL